MMRTYEFDDAILEPGRFRFHVLRVLSVTKYRKELIARQNGKCKICGRPLDDSAEVHHIIAVKKFAYDLTIPLTEAYVRCHSPDNLQAVHVACHRAQRSEESDEK